MVKRIISLFIVFSILFTMVTPVFAFESNEISSDALRVSDEYAKAYPNGVLEFVSIKYDVDEDADAFDVIVARRGGTTGKVEVYFKVVEITSKYGEDFTIQMNTWLGYETLRKGFVSPTMLESALKENKDGFITAPGYYNGGLTPSTIPSAVYGTDSDLTDTVASAVYRIEPELPVEVIEYKSSLHEMRDKALGAVSQAPKKSNSAMNIFDIEDPEAIKVGDALNTILPGVTGHLVFQDGENYKTFRVKIIDDNKFEAPEQFTIGLFEPTGGAVLGDSFNTVVNIKDNDDEIGHVIGFDQKSYFVSPSEGKASLNIARSGDINTYAKIELSTISGTAMADEHYAPIITEAMFLPGETDKKVVIPILIEEVFEELSFEMAITENGVPVSGIDRTTIYIYPEKGAGENLQNSPSGMRLLKGSSMSLFSESAPSPTRLDQWIFIYGDEFAYEGSMADKKRVDWFEPEGRFRSMPLVQGWYRCGSMVKYLDLRGISEVQWRYQNTGDNGSNNKTIVTLNGQINERYGNFADAGIAGLGKAVTFDRVNNSLIRFKNETWFSNHGRLRVDWLQLKRQSFAVNIEQGDSIEYQIWDGYVKDGCVKVSPGTAQADIANPYRDEMITFTPKLSNAGILRGAKLTAYQVKKNGSYGAIKYGTSIKLTPDFIATYIYGNGSPAWNETLTIRPAFGRYKVNSIHINKYDETKGTMMVGDKIYNDRSLNTTDFSFFVGDELIVRVSATAGNRVKGINVYRNGSATAELVPAAAKTNIILSENTRIEPVFEDDTTNIQIQWRLPSLATEKKEVNLPRGMIFHDMPDHMPQSEEGILYRNTSNLKRPVPPVKSDYDDNETYNTKLNQYESALNSYFAAIERNFAEYRNTFEGNYRIERVVNGDVVTLYAKPQDGYTVIWWTNLLGKGGTVTEEEMNKRRQHVGSSFSFTVTPAITDVYYYFTPVSNIGNPIATGKVISSKNTIKHQSIYSVDKDNPKTYKGVPGVDVSVAVANSENMSKTINEVTYKTTAITNSEGEFSIYLPYSAAETVFSVKLMNGERVFAKSVPVANPGEEQLILLEIPFMDEYKVMDMSITTEDSKGTVTISSKPADINIKTRADADLPIYWVRVRSYSSDGRLWKYWDASTADTENWKIYIPNMLESFKEGGRLTVELYDSRMIGHGEIETGYNLYLPPPDSIVALPNTPDYGNGKDQDPIGTIDPDVHLGTTRSLKPVSRNGGAYGTYSVAVGAGEVIKKVIEDNANDFNDRKISDKIDILTQYLRDGAYSKNLLNKDFKPAKGDTSTGRGKGNVTIDFDIGFYIQLTRANENNNPWYFDYSIIYIAAELKAKQDINVSICGVPVYIRLTGGGDAKGLIMAQGNATTKIDTAFGYFPVGASLDTIEYYGLMKFNINIGIGAGLGRRGAISAGVTGRLDLDIGYQPWHAAKGVLTFSLSVDIDVLIIPISFRVYAYTWELFKVGEYNENSWLPTPTAQNSMLRMANAIANENGVSSVGKLERAFVGDWDKSSCAGLKPIEMTTLQSGIYKHPDPKIINLNDGNKMLFYVNDDVDRKDYDRTAVFYSLYDKKKNVWEEPVMLQDDGTADYDLKVKNIGDRIIVTWSSYDTPYGSNSPSLAEQLIHKDIYAQFFNMDGTRDGKIMRLTFDDGVYGNDLPEVAYDESTGNIMVAYIKTDYTTEGVEFSEENAMGIGDFLNNSYSTIAYRIYDQRSGKWQTSYCDDEVTYIDYENEHGIGSLYGQRFIDFSMSGLMPSKVSEMSLSSHNAKALVVYTLDIDQDRNTKDDTELFMMIYDFDARTLTSPIRITDDLDPDTNPHEVEYDGNIYLFWNNNGYISYIELDAIMDYGLEEQEIDEILHYRISEAFSACYSVMDEKNFDAAESFDVTMGNDGNLYVIWNEFEQEKGDEDFEEIQSRNLYIAMYDSKFEQVGIAENDVPIYRGRWGSKWRLTEDAGGYYNEQTLSVDEDGIATVAGRNYKIIPDDYNGGEKEADMSSLVVIRYAPKSTLKIADEDITIYPQYPVAGEDVQLYVNAGNYGFMPSEYVTFQFEMYDDEVKGYVPLGENVVVKSHISSGGTISAGTNFTMPDDISNAKIKITAWEEKLTEDKTEKIYAVNVDDNLILGNCNAYYYSADSIRLQTDLINAGNLDAENVAVAIEIFDNKKFISAFMNKESNAAPTEVIKTFDIGTMGPSGMYSIDEIISIPECYIGKDRDLEFILNVSETKNSSTIKVARENISAYKDKVVTDIAEIQINDGESISIKENLSGNINAKILPLGAANIHTLNYRSLNTDIADIDPSTGEILGKKEGIVEILVEAVKHSDVYFVGGNDVIYDSAGGLMKFNEDGTFNDSAAKGMSNVVASKSVFVTITENDQDADYDNNDAADDDDTDVNLDDKTMIDVNNGDGAGIVQVSADSTLDLKTVAAGLSNLEKHDKEDKILQVFSNNESISIESSVVKALCANNAAVEISLNGNKITLDREVLENIAANTNGDISINIFQAETDEGRPAINIEVLSDNEKITDFGGMDLTVSMPYTLRTGEDENAIVIYYIDENGGCHLVTNSEYKDGIVTFKTNHLSRFAVSYNKVNFEDVSGWAEGYITYLAARNIINGIGNNKFAPNDDVTRAAFVKMLAVLSGDKISDKSETKFTDVPQKEWYVPYVAWASNRGYVLGTSDTTFDPDKNITREQMAVIIYRFMQDRNYELDVKSTPKIFADRADISLYADGAVSVLSNSGIISGKGNNKFEPKESTSRAESAKMLAVLLSIGIN